MKRAMLIITSAMAVMAAAGSTTSDITVQRIADALDSLGCASASVNYEVLLPSSPDAVVYDIDMEAIRQPSDTLAGCDYLISWTLPRQSGVSKGFAAYYDGNHYRYRDTKLQEYHHSADPLPFAGEKGVQRQAQFCELLPVNLAAVLRSMVADSTWNCRVSETASGIRLSGNRTYKGYDGMHFDYTFDARTLLPKVLDTEYNPASISEQTVTARYTWNGTGSCEPVTEKRLMDTFPDVFGKYRASNFHVNNLVGAEMPAFSCRVDGGDRYTRNRGDKFAVPVVFAFLDPSVGSTGETVTALRRASEMAPVQCKVIYVFVSNDARDIDAALGERRPDEMVLMSASSLQRDCGVTAFPTLLFCNTDGMVNDVEIGMNNNPGEVVVQKMTLCR